MDRSKRIERVARELGADRVVPLGKVEHTPIGMLALTDRVRRLRSTGPGGTGRPGDPDATIPRIIKFRPKTWKSLRRAAAEQARRTGRKVSPAQVASILIDSVLESQRPRRRRAQ